MKNPGRYGRHMTTNKTQKLKVAIIGSGNIGTDLLIKVMQSPLLECTLFAGRNFNSAGMKKASSLGVNISDRGIEALLENAASFDLVFDATSAVAHKEHWESLSKLGKIMIDMTPAKLGIMCVPAINTQACLDDVLNNINMITCGGQSSVPVAHVLSTIHPEIEYIEVASSIASRSAGPATRYNIDEYIQTTEEALQKFSGAKRTKAILILNPANPPINMQTTIYAKIVNPDLARIREAVTAMIDKINKYVPGYELIVPPTIEGDKVVITVRVRGKGDYLPPYAGNLDIINCAAVDMAERIAQQRSAA